MSPLSTYRLQLNKDFTFTHAAEVVPYLAKLGITHLYLSPILQASPGSMHGYDVIDHRRINSELGGKSDLLVLSETAHANGLKLIVDVVPNHMAVPSPVYLNHALWSVLKEGTNSAYVNWFDVDLSSDSGILMPVLGERIGTALGEGKLSVTEIEIPDPETGQPRLEKVVKYFDHVFPVAPGTEHLPLAELLDRQWYRLAYWKVADEELNYRRFFDVDTLAAVRVEDPEVFAATHELLMQLHKNGVIDGFRIDHPDGLANPAKYLRDLAKASDNAWVVIEKILEGEEKLPRLLECAGTTGYDALWRINGLFQEPRGADTLTVLWQQQTHNVSHFEQLTQAAKKEIIAATLYTEVERLTALAYEISVNDIRLRDHTRRNFKRAISALLEDMDRYRAYIEPGVPAHPHEKEVILEAGRRAAETLEDPLELETLQLVVDLACGEEVGSAGRRFEAKRQEFVVRFAQTCGPVQAKALEDTAFYRYNRFVSVNEVGSNPGLIGVDPDQWHDFAAELQDTFPDTMTTLSTHDAKRSEDVRARLNVLTELANEFSEAVKSIESALEITSDHNVDPGTRMLLWQTLFALWDWPEAGIAKISLPRLREYLTKAIREAKVHTSWTDQNPDYEAAVLELAELALNNPQVGAAFAELHRRGHESVRANVLGQKLIQLTMPGVCDIYQGQERCDLSLVDPDNRRPVNFELAQSRLDRLSAGAKPENLGDEKQWVCWHALQARKKRLITTTAPYRALATTTGHAVAYQRGQDLIVAFTRLATVLNARGGWKQNTLFLPEGNWRDVLTGKEYYAAEVDLAELFDEYPVALLERSDAYGHHPEVWAPAATSVAVKVGNESFPLEADKERSGWFKNRNVTLRSGETYAFQLDGQPLLLPDPRSRFQPEGVHGPSEVVDLKRLPRSNKFAGLDLRGKVLYEIHIGTFTSEGTFTAAIERLPELKELGVDAIEIMPVAQFPGKRGWGYDGVDLFAPFNEYGRPEDLAQLVAAAHDLGLAVVLDVVYNHLGPAGNYLGKFGPYFTDQHETPWGSAVNLDQAGSAEVRSFILDNARMWLSDYDFDGLRLDAVHELKDDSPRHILADISALASEIATVDGKPRTIFAESDENQPRTVTPAELGGRGMHAQWADDVHHALHTFLTGEKQGYYSDFAAEGALEKTFNQVFLHDGSYSSFRKQNWGAPLDLTNEIYDASAFLVSLQNHDQVGNRAAGDRIHAGIPDYRHAAGAALYLLSPFTPMLFMGEEWATSSPFPFFSDHDDELGPLVSAGRKAEFAQMGWSDEVPDPQAESTFKRAKLNWAEISTDSHQEMREWYQQLLALRRQPGVLQHRLSNVEFDSPQPGVLLYRHGRILVIFNDSDTNFEIKCSCAEVCSFPAQAEKNSIAVPHSVKVCLLEGA